jgi:hypothetical protein
MATSVRSPDQATTSVVRRAARTGYRWLLLVFLLIAANVGAQYALARRR